MNVAGAQVSGYTMQETLHMVKGIIDEMQREGELE